MALEPTMLSKLCGKCGEVKLASFFHKDKKNKTHGLSSYCKQCNKLKAKEHYSKDKDRKNELRLRYRYGLEPGQYEEMLQKQNGVCAICSRAEATERNKRLAVDHCHSTGRVRGLLCSHCNRAIGLLGDNRAILQAAITYLENH